MSRNYVQWCAKPCRGAQGCDVTLCAIAGRSCVGLHIMAGVENMCICGQNNRHYPLPDSAWMLSAHYLWSVASACAIHMRHDYYVSCILKCNASTNQRHYRLTNTTVVSNRDGQKIRSKVSHCQLLLIRRTKHLSRHCISRVVILASSH